MTNRRTWFPVSSGLLTWEHYRRIGSAWMVFQWMIHEQRAPLVGGGNTGIVRAGEPLSYEEISKALQGMPPRTIEKHVTVLERERYILSEAVPRKGKRYWITNAIRWLMVLPKNGGQASNDSPNAGSERASQLPKNGEHFSPNMGSEPAIRDKEVKTKNKTGGLNFDPTTMEIPDWLPRDAWNDFVGHRKEKKNALSRRSAMLNITTLSKLRAEGHDARAVIVQTVANGWTGLFELKTGKYAPHVAAAEKLPDNYTPASERILEERAVQIGVAR